MGVVGKQVTARKEAIDTQFNSVKGALEAEKERVWKLAEAQAKAQYGQQIKALEMQRDQQKAQLDRLEQQEKYSINQQAAQMQQQRAQMELAQNMQKAMFGQKSKGK